MNKILLPLLLMSSTISQAEEVYATFDVEANKTANLAFSYSGIVKQISVDIGSIVKQDEVLASLQSDDLIATNKKTMVSLKYAKLDLQRQQKLIDKKLIDKSQLDKYKNAYENLKAQVEFEKTIYAKTILLAPFDGMIADKKIEVGDVVSGQMIKTAFTIQSAHKRKLIIHFDQKYHNQVKIGDVFRYKLDGDEGQYQSKIVKIYPQVNLNNRKMTAEALVEDVTVGLFGEGTILTAQKAK